MPKEIKKGFIIEGHFDYPPLFPFILSFIPKKKLEKMQGFVAPFFDALHCLAVFIIAYQLTSRIDISLTAQLIYMLIPLTALENSYLTPRSFGYLNFTLALYPLLLYSSTPKIIYLFTAYIFITLIFLSHRFATQSFLFAILFFSIFDRTFFYITVFLLSGLTAILITKGYYLKVLKGHLYNIYFWILNYRYRFIHQVKGTKDSMKNKDFTGKMYYLLGTFSPITLIGTNIWLVTGLIFLYAKITQLKIIPINNPMYYKMSLWIIFFYFFAIAVLSIKKLIPIGEGQRYIEMATAPSAILSSFILYSLLSSPNKEIVLSIFIALLFINFVLIVFVQIKGIIKDKTRSLTKDMENVFRYINNFKTIPRIICIPHQITTMTIYNTKADVLVNADNLGLLNTMDFYPVLKSSINMIAKKYKLNYLLLQESFASTEELKIRSPKVVYKSGNISLIKINLYIKNKKY